MLLFITDVSDGVARVYGFNTSHVTLYHDPIQDDEQSACVSIHLMLLFIISSTLYILAHFYVSIHLMLLFILIPLQK